MFNVNYSGSGGDLPRGVVTFSKSSLRVTANVFAKDKFASY